MMTYGSLSRELFRNGCDNPFDHITRLIALGFGNRVSIYFHKCKVLVGEHRG